MANTNPIVKNLPAYVDENRIGLISKSVLGSRTIGLISLNTGIKDAAAVNLLDTDVKFGDGSTCGWDATDASTLSQRKIETGQIKINVPFCEKNLLKTYANHELRIAADPKVLPFENEFINGIVEDTDSKLEKAVWQGDVDSEDANLNKFDGLVKIIAAEPTVKKATIASGSTMYDAVKAMNKAIPAEVRKANDVVIFMGDDLYADYIQEMVDKNLYHYDASNDGHSYKLPGFNVTIEAVPGLNGTKKMYAGRKANFFYGCDLQDDKEVFDFWYSKDAREFRLDIEFNCGTQVAFPDQIVAGELK